MRISASGLARLAKCRAVAVLPWASQETRQASLGTIVHAYLKDVPAIGKNAALMRVPFEHQAACDSIDLEQLPASEPDSYAFEVGFIYDATTDTAVEVTRGLDRLQPSEGDFIVTGTQDVIGVTETAVVNLDYKTGWADLGPVEDNWQLKFYALSSARAYGKDEAHIGIIRIKEDGDAWYDRGYLSTMDLDRIAGELKRILERADADRKSGEVPAPHQGPHCKYCPAFDACPAKQLLARTRADEGDVRRRIEAGMVREVIEELDAREAVHDRLWGLVDEYAGTRPVDLGGGYVYGSKVYVERRIIPEDARPILETEYGADVADAVLDTKTSISQAGLSRGLRAYVARTAGAKITKVAKSAMEMLEERGAVRVVKSLRVLKFKPKPGELEAAEAARALPPDVAPTPPSEEPVNAS